MIDIVSISVLWPLRHSTNRSRHLHAINNRTRARIILFRKRAILSRPHLILIGCFLSIRLLRLGSLRENHIGFIENCFLTSMITVYTGIPNMETQLLLTNKFLSKRSSFWKAVERL
jgi:hypothetical protein